MSRSKLVVVEAVGTAMDGGQRREGAKLHLGRHRASHRDLVRQLTIAIDKLSENTLRVTLSDDDDACFLCSLTITRNDYDEMKKCQGLLVDFDNFPTQFVRLLQHCENDRMFLSLHGDGPAIVCLEIIERNEFKRLVHLSLRTAIATDVEVKKSMVERILLLKRSVSDAQASSIAKDTVHAEEREFLQLRIDELTNLLSKANEDRSRCDSEFRESLRRERERFDQDRAELRRQIETNAKTHASSIQETLAKKEKHLEESLSRCKILQDTIRSLESQINDKTQRMMNVEKQLHTAKMEVDTWRNQNGALDKDYHDKEQTLKHVKLKLTDIEKALQEKSSMLQDAVDELHKLKKEKIMLEERVTMGEMIATKQEREIQNLNDELHKANQIIAKQNSDILELREKLMCRTAIALEQEKIINKNNDEILKFQEKEKESLENITQSQRECERLQEELNRIKLQLEEKSEIIKNNNSVIQWLHKKIDAIQSMNELPSTGYYFNQTAPNAPQYEASDKLYKLNEKESKLSDIYTRGLNDDNPISSRLDLISDDGLSKNDLLTDRGEYSVDPAYLKPTLSSARITKSSSRSTFQDSSSKNSYTPLPDFVKQNRKCKESKTDARNMNKLASYTGRSAATENRYVKSAISAYFPNNS